MGIYFLSIFYFPTMRSDDSGTLWIMYFLVDSIPFKQKCTCQGAGSTDAHQSIPDISTSHFIRQSSYNASTGSAPWMPDGNGAAGYIHPLPINCADGRCLPSLLLGLCIGQYLGSKSFMNFKKVYLFEF